MEFENILTSRLDPAGMRKIKALDNRALERLIASSILKFQPKSVFVSTGSPEDLHYIRAQAIRNGEENPLRMTGHTIHFDGYGDQGRDIENTRFCLPEPGSLGSKINSIGREEGLKELDLIMDGIMQGKEMIVSFYSLGPAETEFAIPCVQITDSFYVVHSEDILYRQGYDLFRNFADKENFFKFIHSAGVLENGVSRDIDHRRIYMDLETDSSYSTNTQYAGNTVAAKKLAHRLSIRKAAREGWLAEHLLLSGVPSFEGDKVTYISGAFPSWCGKTSTSMLHKIVGDDLAHLRKKDGTVYAVNVEKGMFGVIKDVNPKDDPYIHEVLIQPNEIIFSNVLDAGGEIFWQGMGKAEIPLRGCNHSGPWWKGKKDGKGKPIPISHDNARFSVALPGLKNFDPTPVVPLEGIIYGGRSSKRPVPVSESYGWMHGVYYGASVESEPTAAVIGNGKVMINPMANTEFLSISIGEYISHHIAFGADLKKPPKIFYVNYFLRDADGNFTNTKMDKKVWIRWIERRINGKLSAYATPIGFIPKYEDLAELFIKELSAEYKRADYEEQFALRLPELLEKLDIVEEFYRKEESKIPEQIFHMVAVQRNLLLETKKNHGERARPEVFSDYRAPSELR